jgi:K+-sensing histidine kinase KdpD
MFDSLIDETAHVVLMADRDKKRSHDRHKIVSKGIE